MVCICIYNYSNSSYFYGNNRIQLLYTYIIVNVSDEQVQEAVDNQMEADAGAL